MSDNRIEIEVEAVDNASEVFKSIASTIAGARASCYFPNARSKSRTAPKIARQLWSRAPASSRIVLQVKFTS